MQTILQKQQPSHYFCPPRGFGYWCYDRLPYRAERLHLCLAHVKACFMTYFLNSCSGVSTSKQSKLIKSVDTSSHCLNMYLKQHKAVIDHADSNALFSNIELIHRLNQVWNNFVLTSQSIWTAMSSRNSNNLQTFLANLEKDQHDVGQIFHDFAQYFKMYMPYVQVGTTIRSQVQIQSWLHF